MNFLLVGHKEIVACEGKRRVIMCPRGKYIHILHANYGRTDVKTCPSRWIKTTRCFARKYVYFISLPSVF